MGTSSEFELDPCATRTIKPAKLCKPCTRPIIAIDPGGIVIGEHNAATTFAEYTRNLPYLPPHIVVCHAPETWLWKLHEQWRGHELWSWRVAVTNKHGRALQSKRVAYYGFRDPKKKRNRYHVVFDTSTMFRRQDFVAEDLLELGVTVREFCNTHGLEIRTSAAGIASQLLRHPMFYPFARRRVPTWINEAVRPHLPGGHYDAYTDAAQRMETAMYIDQHAAHHYAAETTPLPNANSVRAIGYTRSDHVYARNGGGLYEKELRKHGLIKAMVKVPWLHPNSAQFAPPLMRRAGRKVAYVWTNELPYLERLGLEVEFLIAMWGTEQVDNGLAKYATWAKQVALQYPQLKALLLMPYGLLARRRGVVTYHHPGDGTDVLILANQLLDDTRARTVQTQPDTANALQLGLIQAFVRSLSLDMAKQLHEDGHEIVSIYADGIFVKLTDGKSLPLFAPWRLKEGDHRLDLHASMRVPARAKLRRDYVQTEVREIYT